MAATIIGTGPASWKGSRDSEGHRVYTVLWNVMAGLQDGPAVVMSCPGLPVPGTPWSLGNDIDLWAWCQNDIDVAPRESKENTRFWTVEQKFSTKNKLRCVDAKVEDPLLEPPKVSGGFDKFTEEATHDMYGRRILSSSHEMLRGKENEWDEARGTLKIQQNVATLYQAATLPDLFKNCVNALPLWGKAPRTLKLTPGSWEQKYHGQCYVYYSRTLEFEHNPRTWDRTLLDEGNKALRGRWDGDIWRLIANAAGDLPDFRNPADFTQFLDKAGGAAHTLLNGYGIPVGAKLLATQFGQIIPRFICRQNTSGAVFEPDEELGIFAAMNGDPGVGHNLMDRDYWREQVGQTTVWAPSTVSFTDDGVLEVINAYIADNVVTHNGNTYLCLRDNQDIEPLPFSVSGDPDPRFWLPIPYTNRGIWNTASDYSVGEYVEGSASDVLQTRTGSRFVQKYPGVNFLLLGVPLIF